MRRRVGTIIAVLAFLGIAVATLTPVQSASVLSPWCIFCGELGAIDFAANVVLFVPLGLGLALAFERRWWPVLVCVGFTVFIETMQIHIVPGRDASLGDVVANTVGGLLGTRLAFDYAVLIRPSRAAAGALSIAWAIVVSIALWGASWGLAAAGRPLSIWIQHVPVRAGFQPVPGALDSFSIEGISLNETYPPYTRPIALALAQPSWHATASLRMHGPPPHRGVIARIVEEATIRLSVEQWGTALACRIKSRASYIKLRDPIVALPGVFPRAAGGADVPTRVTCGRVGGSLVAAAVSGRDSLANRLPLSPALGWALVWPFTVGVDASLALCGLAWLFALGGPAGYWLAAIFLGDEPSSGGSRRRVGAVGPMLAVVVAFAAGAWVAPRVFAIAVPTAGETIAAALGLVGGAAVHWIVRRPARA